MRFPKFSKNLTILNNIKEKNKIKYRKACDRHFSLRYYPYICDTHIIKSQLCDVSNKKIDGTEGGKS